MLQGAKVLLAEDNALNIEIAEFFLQEVGVGCGRPSGSGGLCGVAGRLYDAIPGCDDAGDGRRRPGHPRVDRPDAKTVPIFAMTANAFAEDRQKALAAGMTDHLTKCWHRYAQAQCVHCTRTKQPISALCFYNRVKT